MLLKIPIIGKNIKNSFKKIKPVEGNENFCLAPWIHTHVSTQGERKLCCLSEDNYWENYQDHDASLIKDEMFKDLKDHWNSSYMMNIRKKMMSGEKVQECRPCNDKILAHNPYKDFFNGNYEDKIDIAFDSTDDNGFTTMKPISYDYRVLNLCNFRCRMCDGAYSSRIESENNIHNFYNHPWSEDDNKKLINDFQKNTVIKELWEAVNNKTIEEIYWCGGEPTMWSIHWEVMNTLIENGHAKNVLIRYNTNLSKITHKDYNLYDMLLNFKDIKVACSIDGTEDIVEYIRDGIVWEKWLNNFKTMIKLNEVFGGWAVYMDITVSLPGLFSMKKMIDLALELNVNSAIKSIYSEIILSPLVVPREILDKILNDIIVYAKIKNKSDNKIEVYVKAFEHLKNKKTFVEEYGNLDFKLNMAKSILVKIDASRNQTGVIENIFSQNEELLEWWKNI